MIKYKSLKTISMGQYHDIKGKVTAKLINKDGIITMVVTMAKGSEIMPHKHAKNESVVYVLKGKLQVSLDNKKKEIVNAGETTICLNKHTHGIKNIGNTNAVFFGVVYGK